MKEDLVQDCCVRLHLFRRGVLKKLPTGSTYEDIKQGNAGIIYLGFYEAFDFVERQTFLKFWICLVSRLILEF